MLKNKMDKRSLNLLLKVVLWETQDGGLLLRLKVNKFVAGDRIISNSRSLISNCMFYFESCGIENKRFPKRWVWVNSEVSFLLICRAERDVPAPAGIRQPSRQLMTQMETQEKLWRNWQNHALQHTECRCVLLIWCYFIFFYQIQAWTASFSVCNRLTFPNHAAPHCSPSSLSLNESRHPISFIKHLRLFSSCLNRMKASRLLMTESSHGVHPLKLLSSCSEEFPQEVGLLERSWLTCQCQLSWCQGRSSCSQRNRSGLLWVLDVLDEELLLVLTK